MSKLSPMNKRILFLILMALAGSVFTVVYLIAVGNTDQVYDDIVVEYTAIFSSNKSAERNLPFLLIFAGVVIYGMFYLFTRRKWKDEDEVNTLEFKNEFETKEFVCFLIAVIGSYFLVFQNTHQIVIGSFIVAAILFVIKKELVCYGICIFYLGVYAIIGIYRFYVFMDGVRESINTMLITISATCLSLIPLIFSDKKKAMLRLGMVESIFIPLSLLLYFSNKYKNGEEIITIDVPFTAKALITVVIFCFLLEAIMNLFDKWAKTDSIDDIIGIGTCASIMMFNQFTGSGAIMPTDLHHPFENIVGYSQVFAHGQKLFSEYIPISGMYSIVQGAIFDWFGEGGTFGNYFVTNNLFYLLLILLIILLLKQQLKGSRLLLISLVFCPTNYNRTVFMLPIMLLLIWPKLIEKKNLWIQMWFLTSLFQGLYYPLYGCATCAAFLPLGIYQVISYVKSGELKEDIKNPVFWFSWSFCLFLLALNFNCLSGTLKHMLAMSGQSVLADGISRFGQLIPNWFFSYLTDSYPFVRMGLYHIFTVMIPVVFVWIAFALTVRVAGISFENHKIKVGNVRNACVIISAVIMPIICYTYTFTRLDIDSIYARNARVLYVGVAILFIFLWRFVENARLLLLLTITLISIPGFVNGIGFFQLDSDSKLKAYYTVPEGYVYVEDDEVEKLGSGFIEQGVYDKIKKYTTNFTDKEKESSYMGGGFGEFYLSGVKGDGPMKISNTVKSYSAAQEVVGVARENKSIIIPSFSPVENYYFYHWLLASGEYIWEEEQREFYPNDGSHTREEIREQNKNISIAWNEMNIGKKASSWGLSMESLNKLFTECNLSYDKRLEGDGIVINFDRSFDGDEADFIYVEFANMDQDYVYTLYNLSGEVRQENPGLEKMLMKKKYNDGMTVQLRWWDDNGEIHTMNCEMSEGKLLIPVGAGLKWLFNQHNNISFYAYQNNEEIALPEITDLRFLKIREVR